jgi:hypothetical protein
MQVLLASAAAAAGSCWGGGFDPKGLCLSTQLSAGWVCCWCRPGQQVLCAVTTSTVAALAAGGVVGCWPVTQ